jgi:hypothetical protein
MIAEPSVFISVGVIMNACRGLPDIGIYIVQTEGSKLAIYCEVLMVAGDFDFLGPCMGHK